MRHLCPVSTNDSKFNLLRVPSVFCYFESEVGPSHLSVVSSETCKLSPGFPSVESSSQIGVRFQEDLVPKSWNCEGVPKDCRTRFCKKQHHSTRPKIDDLRSSW